MTLVSEIIKAAYRESNLIALAATVSSNQSTEALNRLNPLVLSTIGNEVGDNFQDITIGGDYDQSSLVGTWLPDNARLLLNLTAAKAYDLDAYPYDGQRLAVVDVGSNLATYNVVLSGNGRLIEGAASLTLNTDDLARQWMYRRDTGNWVRVTTLTTGDELPFPSDFDDYFITMLAMRLNPRYGQELHPATLESLRRSRSQLRARYSNPREIEPDLDTRGFLSDTTVYGHYGTHDFNTGRFYPWR